MTETQSFQDVTLGQPRRSGRWTTEAMRYARRLAEYPDKRAFLRAVKNTYYSNYLNLSLALRDDREDREIRRMARGAVWTYLKNAAIYSVPEWWKGFQVENAGALNEALSHGKGVLIAGQHLGPQRFVLLELARFGKPVHVPVTENFVAPLTSWLARVEQDAGEGEHRDLARRVAAMPVEERTCALKMVRALKRKELVAFDIDGNTGVGGEERTREDTLQLTFLGRRISARKGVAYLSYRTGAPIVTTISTWSRSGRPILKLGDPILPDRAVPQEQFIAETMEHIYGLLESTITELPEEWEMWPHFFKWITPESAKESEEERALRKQALDQRLREALEKAPTLPLHVDPKRAFVLKIRDRRLLIDRHNHRFFLASPVSETVLRLLHEGTTLGHLVARVRQQFPSEDALTEVSRLCLLNLLPEPSAQTA